MLVIFPSISNRNLPFFSFNRFLAKWEKDSWDKKEPLKIVYGEYGQENVFKTNDRDTKEIPCRPFCFFLLTGSLSHLSILVILVIF